jgi:hypothetical protein
VDQAVLEGWGARGYNWEYTVSLQHELMARTSINGGWYRRKYGNQTITVDNRYSIAKGSYDGPFCANAPADPNLPNGGSYQVCGLYDLKPSVVALGLPTSSTVTFSSNYGKRTSMKASTVDQHGPGQAFLQAGSTRRSALIDNLVDAGILAYVVTAATEVAEQFPDGAKACHQDLSYRPDFKLVGSYTLPFDILVSGTFQFVRGIQNAAAVGAAAAPSILATWTGMTVAATTLGRPFSAGATTKRQPDSGGLRLRSEQPESARLQVAKAFKVNRYRFRVNLDVYNILNSNWPFAVTNISRRRRPAPGSVRPTCCRPGSSARHAVPGTI